MVAYCSPILPHVHLRGKEYPNHNYLERGFHDAKKIGALAILEQPNPEPQLTSEKVIKERLRQSEPYRKGIYHGIHIGLTNNLSQVSEAFLLAKEHRYNIAGVKAFWVHSTGNMGILDHEIQKRIWKIASASNYKGVFFQHLEEEEMFRGKFDPSSPATHSSRQSEWSELNSTMRQVQNAYNSGFRGIFYAAHVSSPLTLEFLDYEKKHMPFHIVIETTAHHEFLNVNDYDIHGNGVKMNPPLRDPSSQEKLLSYVIDGRSDIAGDDHASHPPEFKEGENPRSGIQAIAFLPKRVELWRKLGMSERNIERLLFDTANEIFNLDLKKRNVDCKYDPSLWNYYGYNPFSRVDK